MSRDTRLRRYTYGKISIRAAALGQGLADIVHEVLLPTASGADGLLLELDLRHDVWLRLRDWRSWTVTLSA